MTQTESIKTLRTEAAKNPAANAILHMFGLRERARHQVTLRALRARMEREGFRYSDEQYEDFLRLMAFVGFGKLLLNGKGRVKALVDIRTTLQSIGRAACGEGVKLVAHAQRNKFSPVTPTPLKPATALTPVERETAPSGAVAGFPVSITVLINGKPINMRLPKEFTETEIANLLVRFRDKAVV